MGLLLDYQTNQMEADPTAEESEGGDRVILRIVMRMWNLMIFMLVGFSAMEKEAYDVITHTN